MNIKADGYLTPTEGKPVTLWEAWFAWHPVLTDDDGLTWWAPIARRRVEFVDSDLTGQAFTRWQYSRFALRPDLR